MAFVAYIRVGNRALDGGILCVWERERRRAVFLKWNLSQVFFYCSKMAHGACVCGFGITQSDKYNKQLHRPGLAFVRAFEFFPPTFITIFAIVVLPSLALHSFWITAAALNIVIVGERWSIFIFMWKVSCCSIHSAVVLCAGLLLVCCFYVGDAFWMFRGIEQSARQSFVKYNNVKQNWRANNCKLSAFHCNLMNIRRMFIPIDVSTGSSLAIVNSERARRMKISWKILPAEATTFAICLSHHHKPSRNINCDI